MTHLHEYPEHPWMREGGNASDKPIDSAVLSRMKQFRAMNKLKKLALKVISSLTCNFYLYASCTEICNAKSILITNKVMLGMYTLSLQGTNTGRFEHLLTECIFLGSLILLEIFAKMKRVILLHQ